MPRGAAVHDAESSDAALSGEERVEDMWLDPESSIQSVHPLIGDHFQAQLTPLVPDMSVTRPGEVQVTSEELAVYAAQTTAAWLTMCAYDSEAARSILGWRADFRSELPACARILVAPRRPEGRICGTPGCSLPDFHDEPCTSQQPAGNRRSRLPTSRKSGDTDDHVPTPAVKRPRSSSLTLPAVLLVTPSAIGATSSSQMVLPKPSLTRRHPLAQIKAK